MFLFLLLSSLITKYEFIVSFVKLELKDEENKSLLDSILN